MGPIPRTEPKHVTHGSSDRLSSRGLTACHECDLLITPIILSRNRLIGLYDILSMRVQRGVLARSELFQNMSGYQIRKAVLISSADDHAARHGKTVGDG